MGTLVSCDTVDSGCNGGNPINAWGAMNGWGGDGFNKDYPYTSGTTQADGTCKGIVKKDIAANSQPNNCGTSIDHAVQAVGINTDTFSGQKKTYWIVRNS